MFSGIITVQQARAEQFVTAGKASFGRVGMSLYGAATVGTFAAFKEPTILGEDDKVFLVGNIKLYNSEELAKRLGVVGTDISDANLIIYAYKRFDTECLKYLNGDFSFAIWSQRTGELFCARDAVGAKPFYYYSDPRHFVFSDSIHLLSEYSLAQEFDDHWIADSLLRLQSYRDRTVYWNVQRLLPGHLIVRNAGETRIRQYWTLHNGNRGQTTRSKIAVEEFKRLLGTAITSRAGQANGVELSGGLDSSAVAAYLTKVSDEVTAFSNTMPDEYLGYAKGYGDERRQSTLVARHLNIREHFFITGEATSTLESLETALDNFGYPSNFFLPIFQKALYACASGSNVDTLFSGFGGDQIVSSNNNMRYVFSLIRKLKLGAVARHFMTQGDSCPKAIGKTAFFATKLLRTTFANPRSEVIRQYWTETILRQVWSHDEQVRNVFSNNEFFSISQSPKDRIISRLNSGDVTERLETSDMISRLYNLSYRYPLLDKNLIEYYYNLPEEVQIHDKLGRGLLRASVEGLLPNDIVGGRKGRDSIVAPYALVEAHENFSTVMEYCLSISPQTKVFDFVDRRKIVRLNTDRNDVYFLRRFSLLKSVAMLSMFFDKRIQTVLHEL